jgi:hypothetical protein
MKREEEKKLTAQLVVMSFAVWRLSWMVRLICAD